MARVGFESRLWFGRFLNCAVARDIVGNPERDITHRCPFTGARAVTPASSLQLGVVRIVFRVASAPVGNWYYGSSFFDSGSVRHQCLIVSESGIREAVTEQRRQPGHGHFCPLGATCCPSRDSLKPYNSVGSFDHGVEL